MRVSIVGLCSCLALLLCSCVDSTTSPTAVNPRFAAVPPPLCLAGCQETDPYPDSAGMFLSSTVTPSLCFNGSYADADEDGLGDFCETQLAAAFAPELYYASDIAYDDVRREPYWVAKIQGPLEVRIGYLLSYYRDLGSQNSYCSGPVPLNKCDGHDGDSEWIFLDVYYNSDAQHWVLMTAYYSEHTSYAIYGEGAHPYPDLYYPTHPGAYPRSYVSEGKHANYDNLSDCNNGGFFGVDTCAHVDTGTRVQVSAYWNLGSREFHGAGQGLDCVESRNPDFEYYGSGRTECYWTDQTFRGWIPDSAGGAGTDAYSGKLSAWGF